MKSIKKKLVTWKDEMASKAGPCRVWLKGVAATVWEYGTEPPDCIYHGWVTKEEAQRLAKTLDAEFEET